MKKVGNKTVFKTGGFLGIGKTSAFTTAENIIGVNTDLKYNNADRIMEEVERESSKSVFIKLMNQYISRLHLQFNK